MLRVDLVDCRTLIEIPHRVPTEQREIVSAAQLVPQRFQANRPRFAAVLPEQIDHLSIGSDGAMLASATDLRQDSPKRAAERAGVRHAVRHEELQRVVRIECHELAKTLQRIDVGAAASTSMRRSVLVIS